MFTLISVASNITVVLGYNSLNEAGIVLRIVDRSGQQGSEPRRR